LIEEARTESMQAKNVEFSRPELHPHRAPAALVTPCGISFMTSFVPHPVVVCSSGDVNQSISRPQGGWSATDRCVSRDHGAALQEPVDLSLHRVNQSSSSTTAGSRQRITSHGHGIDSAVEDTFSKYPRY